MGITVLICAYFQATLLFFCLVCGAPLKKKSQLCLIKLVGVSQCLCAVCVDALLRVFLVPIGHGIVGLCSVPEAHGRYVTGGGRVPRHV